jgi:hypothetical protein
MAVGIELKSLVGSARRESATKGLCMRMHHAVPTHNPYQAPVNLTEPLEEVGDIV